MTGKTQRKKAITCLFGYHEYITVIFEITGFTVELLRCKCCDKILSKNYELTKDRLWRAVITEYRKTGKTKFSNEDLGRLKNWH